MGYKNASYTNFFFCCSRQDWGLFVRKCLTKISLVFIVWWLTWLNNVTVPLVSNFGYLPCTPLKWILAWHIWASWRSTFSCVLLPVIAGSILSLLFRFYFVSVHFHILYKTREWKFNFLFICKSKDSKSIYNSLKANHSFEINWVLCANLNFYYQ